MKSLKEFVIKNLKLNKKRTIVTIIGIILSTALICAVSGLVTSIRQTMVNMTIETQGNYHVTFKDLSKEELKEVKKYKNIDSYFLTRDYGWAKLPDSKNDDKPYVLLKEFDKSAFNNYGVKLISGRLPENSNEVVVSESIMINGRVDLKIGDKLNLDIGDRVNSVGEKIASKMPYSWSEEKLTNNATKSFVIVGIIKRPNYTIEDFGCPRYSVITLLDEQKDDTSISVLYSNYKNYVKNNEEVDEIAKTFGKEQFEKILNNNLLRFMVLCLNQL